MTLSSILWLRSRLLARLLFNKDVIALLLIVIGFLFFLLYAIVTTGLSATVMSSMLAEPGYLSAALFGLFLFLTACVITYVLFAGSRLRSMGIDYQRVSHLPVNPLGFYLAETLASFVDLWIVLVMPFLLGTIWGLHLYAGISTFVTTMVIFGCFVLLLGVVNQFILYVVDCLFRFIGGRLIRFMAFCAYCLCFSGAILAGADSERQPG